MLKVWRILIVLISLLAISNANAAIDITISDQPNDNGRVLIINWNILNLETDISDFGYRYTLQRATTPAGSFTDIFDIVDDKGSKTDSDLDNNISYYYRIKIAAAAGETFSASQGPFSPKRSWFHTGRLNVLIGLLITGILVGAFILWGKKGGRLYTRPIAGLNAVDEAIGRATEMGKPILYSAGRGTMQRPATIASMNILSSVIEKVASYNTPLIFPNNDPVTMAVAQEVAYEGYARAGHPENYKPDNIFFVTDSQFGYAAAVDGIMLRERPATNLFFGTFEAESLILAETGNSIGAMQIAGTDSSIQMSFFIVACDYVLIGEELFAASGYLSQDLQVLGSLKGSDYTKLIIIVIIIIGAVLAIIGNDIFLEWLTIR
ncbi:MAG: hypothetical protein J7K40_04345 [candidate division Zixibacteria bacterium]|nr:hypothetical protein [candidate division Zixibacteria bacterium]